MSRILVGREWYEVLASSSHYESDYEAVILQYADLLFPDFEAVEFKALVSSEYGERRPDFALVEKSLRNWWVVEVELGHHPLAHITEQVAVFATGTYSDVHAEYLCKRTQKFNPRSLRQLMRGSQPQVLVIVDAPKPEWAAALRPWRAELTVIEVYRSNRNQLVLRMDGEYPSVQHDILSTCRIDPGFQRLVVLDSPARLPPSAEDKLRIWFEDRITEWEIIQSKDKVWLNPVRTNPLLPGVGYALVTSERGVLSFKRQ